MTMTTTATPTMPSPSTSFERDRVPLDDAAQALIDARLETIERMLFGQTPRADRLAVVREVESQIYELLTQRDPNDTDRDAVIAALARLDPPEAYLPDDAGTIARTRTTASARFNPPLTQPRAATTNDVPRTGRTAAVVSGVTGIASILLVLMAGALLWVLIGATGNDTALFYAYIALGHFAFATAIVAVTLAATLRVKHVWAVVGLVTGIIGLVGTFPMVFYFMG